MLKKTSELEFRHFSTSNPGEFLDLNERAFDLWEKVWKETFTELNVDGKKVWSDDYLHKELVGFFDNGRPAGFMLHTYMDLSRPSVRRMAYFANYPDDVFDKVCAERDFVMIGSYMTIDPEWRKSQTDYPISELIIGLTLLRMMESRASRFVGYFRNNRGTQNIFYRHGGIPIVQNERAYNVDVDFASVPRDKCVLSTLPHCAELTRIHWMKFKYLIGGNPDDAIQRIRENEELNQNSERNALEQPDFL